jgi:hypothetical protein
MFSSTESLTVLINDPLLKSDENVIEKFSIQSSP